MRVICVLAERTIARANKATRESRLFRARLCFACNNMAARRGGEAKNRVQVAVAKCHTKRFFRYDLRARKDRPPLSGGSHLLAESVCRRPFELRAQRRRRRRQLRAAGYAQQQTAASSALLKQPAPQTAPLSQVFAEQTRALESAKRANLILIFACSLSKRERIRRERRNYLAALAAAPLAYLSARSRQRRRRTQLSRATRRRSRKTSCARARQQPVGWRRAARKQLCFVCCVASRARSLQPPARAPCTSRGAEKRATLKRSR